MNTMFRLFLITLTIGGGFAGFAVTFELLFRPHQNGISYLIAGCFAAMYAFVLVSGLIFVQNPQRLIPMAVAFAIQIPVVSSPVIVYRFFSGFHATLDIIGNRIGFWFRLGAAMEGRILHNAPWGFGLNLFAMSIFVLLVVRIARTWKR